VFVPGAHGVQTTDTCFNFSRKVVVEFVGPYTDMDRSSYLYRSGDLFLGERARRFLETFLLGNYSTPVYITYWSVLHLLSGVAFAYVCAQYSLQSPYVLGFLVHGAWELWQIAIGMSHPLRLTGHNGLVDILMDTLLFLVGMWAVLKK
jgi:hypothetical protein